MLFVDEERQQRASLLLRNVEHVIDAHFEMTSEVGPDDNPGKHADMARSRIARGQCVQQPCFGCREFPAFFEAVAPEASFDGTISATGPSGDTSARPPAGKLGAKTSPHGWPQPPMTASVALNRFTRSRTTNLAVTHSAPSVPGSATREVR